MSISDEYKIKIEDFIDLSRDEQGAFTGVIPSENYLYIGELYIKYLKTYWERVYSGDGDFLFDFTHAASTNLHAGEGEPDRDVYFIEGNFSTKLELMLHCSKLHKVLGGKL